MSKPRPEASRPSTRPSGRSRAPVSGPPAPDAAPTRQRGRPPNPATRRAILDAASALLEDGGPGAVTMEAVAERAGVGKPTVYRWWPDRHAVVMAALMHTDAAQTSTALRRRPDALDTLRLQLRAITRRFATASGRHVASLLAASDPDSELARAFRNHFVLARREEGRALLADAIRQRALDPRVDLDVALDALYGPVFFRLLLGHAPLDEPFVDRLVTQLTQGLAPRPGAKR